MGKYFGTDGIRGVANTELTADLAYRTGFALGCRLETELQRRPRVLVGRDTRISGSMLEAALTAGLCAAGSDVISLGVLPTPAVARATVADPDACAGCKVGISQSCNDRRLVSDRNPGNDLYYSSPRRFDRFVFRKSVQYDLWTFRQLFKFICNGARKAVSLVFTDRDQYSRRCIP